jgi:hypothetical protein
MTMRPEGIQPTEKAVPSTRPEPIGQGPGGGSSFAEMVQAPAGASTGGTRVPSAADVAAQKIPAEAPTASSLANQASSTSEQMANLSSTLQNPNLKVSKADQKLLLKKLPRANEAARAAAKQAGIDVGAKVTPSKGLSLLQKSLLFLTDGQAKLNAVSQQMKRADLSNMKPSDMLMIQTKLTAASQEIGFLTNMLGSLTSGVKTLMNIQV